MKKTLLLFFFLIALCINALASTFGYSNGNCGRNNVARVGTTELQGLLIRLDNDKVKMLAGKTISGVQAVLASRNGKNLKLFVSETPDGEALAGTESATISKTNQWADYTFAAPYVVKGTEENLYIGFTYEIASTYSPLSFDFSQDCKGVSYAYENGKWVDTYGMGFGMPNIKLVTNETFDIADFMVKTFTPTGFLKVGMEYKDMEAQLVNIGNTAVKSFTAKVKVGNNEESTEKFETSVEPGSTFDMKLPTIVAKESGRQTVAVTISDIVFANGATSDADLTDNKSSEEVFFYAENVTKKLLVEAFTGQTCSNCPTGHRTMKTALEKLEEEGVEVVEIAHHAGYSADNFTMTEDGEYCFFYNNNGSTYAPAVMVNRWRNPLGTDKGPVFNVSETNITKNATAALNQEPYVTLDFTSDYNETTREAELKLDIHCHRKPEGPVVFNIMVAQDPIITYQVSGGEEYVHTNVSRGTIAGNAWGYDITSKLVEGETFTFTKTCKLPETIKSTSGLALFLPLEIPTVAKDMKFIAYVSAYSETDANANEVYNCAETPLMKDADGIHSVSEATGYRVQSTGFFNLSGQKVGENYRGIVVKNGKKVLK